MKKTVIFLLSLILSTTVAHAFNELLNDANTLYHKAVTYADYDKAEKKYISARSDVDYNPQTDDKLIEAGIQKCQDAKKRLEVRLTVNGNTNTARINFPKEGKSISVDIKANQGTFDVTALPDWLGYSRQSSGIALTCAPNPASTPRHASFRVTSQGKTVTVEVGQSGSPDQHMAATLAQPTSKSIQITDVQFANGTDTEELLTPYGAPLYSSDMKYLFPRLTYNGPDRIEEKTLGIKLYRPDGTLDGAKTAEYSYTTTRTFKPGTANTVTLTGWGKGSGSNFPTGNYQMEIWDDGHLIHTANLRILRKPGEALYLKVDGKEHLSVEFDPQGGQRSYAVETDADVWSFWGVPTFCKVKDVTPKGFILVCQPNETDASRRDFFKIKAGQKEVLIELQQSAINGSATISEVTPMLNVETIDGEMGMAIRSRIECRDLKGRTLRVAVKFYKSDNTTPLTGTDGKQIEVSTQKEIKGNSIFFTWTADVAYRMLNLPDDFHGTLSYNVEVTDPQSDRTLAVVKNSRLSF